METRKSKLTRRPLTQNKRQQGKKWMGLVVVLGFIFLLIGFGLVKNGYGSPFKLVFGDGQRTTKDLLLPQAFSTTANQKLALIPKMPSYHYICKLTNVGGKQPMDLPGPTMIWLTMVAP